MTRDPLTTQKRLQLAVPDSLKVDALSGIHDHAGHQGQPRTLSLASQCSLWHDLKRDVRVRCCHRCVLSKTTEPFARAPLESIKNSAPLELVCVDFWLVEGSNDKSVDVLVITDHFTRLVHAFHCWIRLLRRLPKNNGTTFLCLQFPSTFDQGANFESELIAELLRLSGITHITVSSYG